MSTRCSPTHLRTEPLRLRGHGPRSLKTLAVIAHLAAGKSRLEAARLVGLDKANVRVIELRAKRRGLLGGPATIATPSEAAVRGRHARPDDEMIAARVRMALVGSPNDSNAVISHRCVCSVRTVAKIRQQRDRGRP